MAACFKLACTARFLEIELAQVQLRQMLREADILPVRDAGAGASIDDVTDQTAVTVEGGAGGSAAQPQLAACARGGASQSSTARGSSGASSWRQPTILAAGGVDRRTYEAVMTFLQETADLPKQEAYYATVFHDGTQLRWRNDVAWAYAEAAAERVRAAEGAAAADAAAGRRMSFAAVKAGADALLDYGAASGLAMEDMERIHLQIGPCKSICDGTERGWPQGNYCRRACVHSLSE